jgi:hypothetical protein
MGLFDWYGIFDSHKVRRDMHHVLQESEQSHRNHLIITDTKIRIFKRVRLAVDSIGQNKPSQQAEILGTNIKIIELLGKGASGKKVP